MDLEHALNAHSEWKEKFLVGISTNEKFDVGFISAYNSCLLGEWLYGEAVEKYLNLDSFTRLVQRHAAFHEEAGKVALLINQKEFDSARAQMDSHSPYTLASHAVFAAITVFKSEAKL